nr:MAG TPA: hypothetical protein [Bacteriophage sp.]
MPLSVKIVVYILLLNSARESIKYSLMRPRRNYTMHQKEYYATSVAPRCSLNLNT